MIVVLLVTRITRALAATTKYFHYFKVKTQLSLVQNVEVIHFISIESRVFLVLPEQAQFWVLN